jgi:TfoX/Sxy family transcriptional regulator of competence genes
MAYSKSLAARVRQSLAGERGIVEKQMFGGLGFLLRGNLCVAVWADDLIVRIGPPSYESALREPGVRPFDATGRPMKGWVVVAADALDSDRTLGEWIERALQFVAELPAK